MQADLIFVYIVLSQHNHCEQFFWLEVLDVNIWLRTVATYC